MLPSRHPLRTAPVPLIFAALLLALVDCAHHHAPPPSIAAPESVGLSTKGLAQVHALFDQAVRDGKIAGSVVLIARHGKVAFVDSVGFADREAARPMTADTLFRICSMTKPVTAVAAMILVDEGKLALSDPLSKFVPEFKNTGVAQAALQDGKTIWKTVPAEREITVRDLLTHTSGLTYGFSAQRHIADQYRTAGVTDGLLETPLTLAENTRLLAKVPLLHQPGSAWEYGLSSDVLGRVIEVASGQPLDAFFRDRIFAPLGMNDTFFHVPAQKQARLATAYRLREDGTIERQAAGPVTYGNDLYSFSYPTAPNAYVSGGGGLVSTILDYTRFLHMLAGGGQLDGVRILAQETVAAMTSNQIGDMKGGFSSLGDRYGLGLGVVSEAGRDAGQGSVGTFSWAGFYFTYFWVDPKKDLIAITMAQLHPKGDQTLWQDFRTATYQAVTDP